MLRLLNTRFAGCTFVRNAFAVAAAASIAAQSLATGNGDSKPGSFSPDTLRASDVVEHPRVNAAPKSLDLPASPNAGVSVPQSPTVGAVDALAPSAGNPSPREKSSALSNAAELLEPLPATPPLPPTATDTATPTPPVATSELSTAPTPLSHDAAPPFILIEAPPTDLWDRIRAGFAMPDLEDDLVGKWEKYYADRPDYVARIVDRSSKYMFYIVTELERRNLPLEIALLPMIESAFNPIAHSSAKASGIWQFIPSTGTQFGMKQDWWADSRRDIVAATNGAIDYLTKLHGMFGDWQLALASYNWGEGSVMRASNRAKASGRDGTYLTLNMPAETRNYLPKLQAVKNIIRNPAAYGLTIASVPNEPYFKTITLAHAIDLKKAAQLASMTEAEFVALNPAHNRPVIVGRGDFQILLPADKADQFLARLEADARPRVSWRAYKTKPGDRVEVIAQRFGVTAEVIRSVNGIRAISPALPAGYNILVPADGPSDEALGSIQNAVFTKFPESRASSAHRVRKGETLASIAKRYGVAAATLAKWNRLNKQSVRAGQTLYISGPAPTRNQAKHVRAASKKGGKVAKASKGTKKSVRISKSKRR